MAQVALCVPHAGKAAPQVNRALLTMQGNFPQHQFIYVEVDSVIVGKARNLMTELALSNHVDVVFMIDDDVLVPPEAGTLIDQALILDVVSGVYYNRRVPYNPQLFERALEYPDDFLYWPLLDLPETDKPFKVEAVGAGCLCIKASVLEKMKEIHTAKFKQVAEGIEDKAIAHVVKNLSPWFEFLDKKGEDMYFCERAAEAGFSIWADPRIQCEHIGDINITKDHFQYLKDSKMIVKETRS